MSEQKSPDSSVLQNVLKSQVTMTIAKGAADMLIASVSSAGKNAKKSYIENCMKYEIINIENHVECSKLLETYIQCKTIVLLTNKLKMQTNNKLLSAQCNADNCACSCHK